MTESKFALRSGFLRGSCKRSDILLRRREVIETQTAALQSIPRMVKEGSKSALVSNLMAAWFAIFATRKPFRSFYEKSSA